MTGAISLAKNYTNSYFCIKQELYGLNDIELIRLIIQGDTKAERTLIERFDDKIRMVVFSRLYNYRDEAEDVIQDIKISILVSLRRGNFNPDTTRNLGGYIYGIVLNKISDFFKKQSKFSELHDYQIENMDFASMNNSVEQEERGRILKIAMSKLKDKYQEVLYLRYFKEYSVSEISEMLDLPPRRVSERVNYALKLIKKELQRSKYFDRN